MIVIACFTGTVTTLINFVTVPFNSLHQKNYYESQAYIEESLPIIRDLTELMNEYRNEEYILKGKTVSSNELKNIEDELFYEFENSQINNDELNEKERNKLFKQKYVDKIAQEKDKLIKENLREYHQILQRLDDYNVPLFYASDGKNVYTNTKMKTKQQFEAYPAYFIFDYYEQEIYPKEARENENIHWITDQVDEMNPENTVLYLAFPKSYVDSKMKEWEDNRVHLVKNLYKLAFFVPGFIISFIYLALVIGRNSFKDEKVHLHAFDRLYNDVNIVLCISLSALFIGLFNSFFEINNDIILPISVTIATAGFVLILSLIKHMKNKTIIKHTLLYTLISKFAYFIGDVYQSGNLAVKTVLIVVGYPLLIALTFFMFPITIGFAAWFALKKVKSFLAIQSGVEQIKSGDLQYRIDVESNGEFAKLADDINSITDGLKQAVARELKSERLKTELITNVSHDIRTPLTSIITYVDLLKNEDDPKKVKEYIDVLDQKSKRLKALTDNLFEAAKASSGDIPVQLEKIDIISLINQGLGEVNDKIIDRNLHVKLNVRDEKFYLSADGRLLWRAIEKILSNIFKYALEGSRVYIDIEDLGDTVQLTFKNISATELNISADELMERFKRGDESRTSEGSGLGLSIAKSLIEIQKGTFHIQIDGDLFKAIIVLPKFKEE